MKTIYSLLIISIVLLLNSCSKNDKVPITKEVNNAESQIGIENGILTFHSYEQFFKTLTSIGSLQPSDRIKWEEQLGFTSIKTLYENFNTQIDDIEASSKTQQQYNSKLSDLLIKYNGVVKQMPDGVYNINCNGLMEANLLNKEALVKVEDDVIYFGADSIYTFPDQSIPSVKTIIQSGVNLSTNKSLNIVNNSKIEKNIGFTSISKVPNTYMSTKNSAPGSSYLGSHPMQPGKLFTVTNQVWQRVGSQNDASAEFNARLRFFNIATSNGVRGFVTINGYTTKKNWIGIRRKINTWTVDAQGQSLVIFRGSNGYSKDNLITFQGSRPIDGDNIEDYELPIVISNYFTQYNNVSELFNIVTLTNHNHNAFINCYNVLNDDEIVSRNGWWAYLFTQYESWASQSAVITNPLYFNIMARGEPPLAELVFSNPLYVNGNEASWQ